MILREPFKTWLVEEEQPKYYAGIGSRGTPENVLAIMTATASRLHEDGFILRSGGARGADSAFAEGTPLKEVFRAGDAKPWAFAEASNQHLPSDRGGFWTWSPYVRGLIARNMMQVLGENGDSPVLFVLCWAPSLYYEDSSSGGTGYAIRCAIAHGIPVFNMKDDKVLEAVTGYAWAGYRQFWL